jgi:hypothetical protein
MSTSQEAVVIPTLDELLSASQVTPEFAEAAREVSSTGRSHDLLRFGPGNPPVKVLRALCGLLENHPQLVVRQVEVRGQSGCSDYRGELIVNGGERRFAFVWDCAWKASQLDWKDYFGEPDQIRAARTYGYRCFQQFKEI